jgi:parallel beta-helix repeat protein
MGVNGINIVASNVTLNLNGHTITGPQAGGNSSGTGGTGIAAFNAVFAPTPQIQNVQIQGPGLIQDFQNGIYLQAVANSQVNDVVLVLNSFGIVTNFGTNDQFKGNVAAQNTIAGFDLRDSNDQVQLNAATANGVTENGMVGLHGVGIEIEGNGNVVFNNSADGNLNTGIYIASGNNNQIHANTAFGNTSYGIVIQGGGGGGNDIHANTALGNGGSPSIPFFTGDLADGNYPGCGTNTWSNDTFLTALQPCDD